MDDLTFEEYLAALHSLQAWQDMLSAQLRSANSATVNYTLNSRIDAARRVCAALLSNSELTESERCLLVSALRTHKAHVELLLGKLTEQEN